MIVPGDDVLDYYLSLRKEFKEATSSILKKDTFLFINEKGILFNKVNAKTAGDYIFNLHGFLAGEFGRSFTEYTVVLLMSSLSEESIRSLADQVIQSKHKED